MADTNMQNRGMNPFIAGVVGAVVGAGTAVIASKVLSDKNMREKLMKTASDVKGRITDTIYHAKEEMGKKKEEMKNGQAAISHRLRIGARGRGGKRGRKSMSMGNMGMRSKRS